MHSMYNMQNFRFGTSTKHELSAPILRSVGGCFLTFSGLVYDILRVSDWLSLFNPQ